MKGQNFIYRNQRKGELYDNRRSSCGGGNADI